jgi:CDP-6-deoxy-D-xylo-4-hexulose-3-dehydrase
MPLKRHTEFKMFWPLMKNCITEEDKKSMIDFISSTDRFTNGPKVREFEAAWSEWLGCKYSLFVSSGSTANLLLVAAVKEKYNLKSGDKVLLPAMTWVTNVSPIIQLGLEPIFCDVDLNNFGFDLKHLECLKEKHPDIKLAFVTHLFGISADMDEYKRILPDTIFIEDVCESHGATYKGKKAGTLSEGSTFSFYFGHHMTTIEGGFVCTNDEELYSLMKMKRSHGMAREASPQKFEQYKEMYPDVHPQFLFVTDGYNLRSMELNAVLGMSQLKGLDSAIERRKEIYKKFLSILKDTGNFHEPNVEGNSSFCLPFICETEEIKQNLEKYLQNHGVETRPLCSGNLLRQPFLQDYNMDIEWDANVEYLHKNGFFIGNNHLITDEEISKLEDLLRDF